MIKNNIINLVILFMSFVGLCNGNESGQHPIKGRIPVTIADNVMKDYKKPIGIVAKTGVTVFTGVMTIELQKRAAKEGGSYGTSLNIGSLLFGLVSCYLMHDLYGDVKEMCYNSLTKK